MSRVGYVPLKLVSPSSPSTVSFVPKISIGWAASKPRNMVNGAVPGSAGFSSGSGGGNRGNVGVTRFSGDGESGGNKPGGGLWNAYLQALEKAPLLTKALTCAVLNGVGDALSQLVFEDHPFQWGRFAKFVALGGVFVGPVLSTWYGWLNRVVTATGLQRTLIMLLADQAVFAPIFIGSFISILQTLDGKASGIATKLRTDLPEAVKVNWTLWIPCQFINFNFVPPSLQTLVANLVAVVWNTYLSFVSNRVVVTPA